MADLNLGRAVFDFALNGAGLVSGLSSAGSAVAGFADKATAGYGKAAKATTEFSKKASEADNAIRSQEEAIDDLEKQLKLAADKMDKAGQAWTRHVTQVKNAGDAVKKHEQTLSAYATDYTKQVERIKKANKSWTDTQVQQEAKREQAEAKRGLKASQTRLATVANRAFASQAEFLGAERMRDDLTYRLGSARQGLNASQIARQQMGDGPKQLGPVGQKLAGINVGAAAASQSFERFDTQAKSVYRSLDRMTMGFRGLSPQMQRARENMYQAEAAAKSHTARIEQQKTSINQLALSIERQEKQDRPRRQAMLLERRKEIEVVQARIDKETALLHRMKLTDDGYVLQRKRIEELNANMQTRIRTMQLQEKQGGIEDARLVRHKAQLETERAQLAKLTEQQEKHNQRVKLASEYVDKLKEKTDKKRQATEKDTKAVKDSTEKLSLMDRILNSIFGSSKKAEQGLRGVSSASSSIRPMSFNATALATGVGAAGGSLIGQMIGGLSGASALYKTYENLTMTMNAMSRAEIENADAMKNYNVQMFTAQELAQSNLQWVEKLALKSPYTSDDVKGAFQLGQALGFTSEQTRRVVDSTTNWAASTGQSGKSIEIVTRALGQMHANQRTTLEDLNQLTNAGIGWQAILEKEFAPEMARTGKSIRDLISAGIVPADRAIDAILGKFEHDFPDGAATASNSLTGLLASLQDLSEMGLRKLTSGIFDLLKGPLGGLVQILQDNMHLFEQAGIAIGDWLAGAFERLTPIAEQFREVMGQLGPIVQDSLAIFGTIANEAYGWGSAIIEQFAAGILDYASMVIDAISQIGSIIASWMEPHSPPKFLPDIDQWGSATMGEWTKGLVQGLDSGQLDLFNDLQNQMQNLLGTSGEGEEGIIPRLFGGSSAIRNAIDEFKNTGSVADSTFASIRSAAGAAGERMEGYARSVFAVQKAQAELNNLTKQYDDRLKPLQSRLDAIRARQQSRERQNRVSQINATLGANQASGFGLSSSTRASLADEAEGLTIEDQIAAIEQERTAAVRAAEDKLATAQKELELRQSMIASQDRQNALVAQQIQLLERLATSQEQSVAQGGAAMEAEQKRQAAEAARLSESEFRAALAGAATTEEKLDLVRARMANFAQDTVEYQKLLKEQNQLQLKLDTDLMKSEEKRAKAEEVTRKKELEANLALMDRGEQIKALTEYQNTLTEGSNEWLDVQKRINSLSKAEAAAGGAGGGGGGGPEGMLAGGPLKGLDLEKPVKTLATLNTNIAQVSEKAQIIQARVRGFFSTLQQFVSPLAFVLERFAKGVISALVVNQLLGPIMTLGRWLLSLVTWGNLAKLAVVGFAYAIHENVGGIREIITKVVGEVQPQLKKLADIFGTLKDAFQGGGIGGLLKSLSENAGGIGESLMGIGESIAGGVVEWVSPFANALLGMILEAVDFVANNIGGVLEGMRSWAVTMLVTLGAYLVENVPIWYESLKEAIRRAVVWLKQDGIPQLLNGIGLFLGAAVGPLLAGIVIALSRGGEVAVKIVAGLIPMVPSIIGALLTFAITALTSFVNITIPTIIGEIGRMIPIMFNEIGKMLPELGLNLGRMLGQVLFQILAFLVITVGNIVKWLKDGGLIDLSTWFIEDFGPSFLNMLKGVFGFVFGLLAGILIGIFDPVIAAFRVMGSDTIKGLGIGIDEKWGGFMEDVVTFFDSFVTWVREFLGIETSGGSSTVFKTVMSAVVQGLIDGINAMWSLFSTLVQTKFNEFVTWVKTFLGISSPSTVFKDIAKMLIQGLIDGIAALWPTYFNDIDKKFNDLKTTVTQTFEDLLTAVTDKVSRLSGIIYSYLESAKNQAVELGTGIANGIKQGLVDNWQSISNWFDERIGALRQNFDDWLSNMRGRAESGSSEPDPGHTAHGGIIAGGKPRIVGEVGPELIIPKTNSLVITNERLMRTLAMLAGAENSRMGLGSGVVNQNVVMHNETYNLTLRTDESSRGLVSDFNMMKAMRRV